MSNPKLKQTMTDDQFENRGGTIAFTVRVRVMPDGKVFIEKPPGAVGRTVPLPNLAAAGAWLLMSLDTAYGKSRRLARGAR